MLTIFIFIYCTLFVYVVAEMKKNAKDEIPRKSNDYFRPNAYVSRERIMQDWHKRHTTSFSGTPAYSGTTAASRVTTSLGTTASSGAYRTNTGTSGRSYRGKEPTTAMKAVKCPNCTASLSVEFGKPQRCEYCGTFVDVFNDDAIKRNATVPIPAGGPVYLVEGEDYDALQEKMDELEDLKFELEMTRDEVEDALFDLEMGDYF